MRYIADLHIHSKHSRATSSQMDLEHIAYWAKLKGISIVATADFTHPAWFRELKNKLTTAGNGLYTLKEGDNQDVNFILSTEVSCIYKKQGRTRRIHLVILAPDLEAVKKLNIILGKHFNLKSDGRPIFGVDAEELAKIIFEADENFLIIPAHVWTPWFSLYGSESGFDSMTECFGKLSDKIYAIETGLSSDPAMNWRLRELDNKTIISNSDAHSGANLGREANVLDLDEVSYAEIARIIREKDTKKFLYTIEFFPEEGKYHWDGHRACHIQFSPTETIKNKGICPVCKKPLTIGVLNRVEAIADRAAGEKPDDAAPFKSLVPLEEIIAVSMGKGKNTKGVREEYLQMCQKGGSEFEILLDRAEDELKKITSYPKVAEGIKRVREGKIEVDPGYDGVYGVVRIFNGAGGGGPEQASLF